MLEGEGKVAPKTCLQNVANALIGTVLAGVHVLATLLSLLSITIRVHSNVHDVRDTRSGVRSPEGATDELYEIRHSIFTYRGKYTCLQ